MRGFAVNKQRAYAAVEVGGVLRSDNGGEIWYLLEARDGDTTFVHPDVHSIVVHPSSPDLIYTPTGGGFYRSLDGGASWRKLYECYCRAIWVDPGDSDHLILGPADGVDRNGRIEESRDGGQTWRQASAGLDVPWPNHMVERFAQVGDELMAVLSNGELFSAPLTALTWRRLLPDIQGVAAVTVLSV